MTQKTTCDATRLNQNGGDRTILIVDDDEQIVRLLKRYLMWRGFDILTAANGEEALDRIAGNGHVAAVLLDVDMPGMNGRQALPLILEKSPQSRVIMCSGFDGLDADEFLDLGACHCLRKPFRMDALLSVMDHALTR
jgi:DNA-binding NtrC family response regulator